VENEEQKEETPLAEDDPAAIPGSEGILIGRNDEENEMGGAYDN